MKTKLLMPFIVVCAISIISCNKEKQTTKTLEGTTWIVTELKVDGVADTSLPTLDFKKGKLYKENMMGVWHNIHSTSEDAQFIWQFRDKGKTFEISNQSDSASAYQCSAYSGIYTIDYKGKDSYEMSSNATYAYPSKKVILIMKKK
jgi:hypothetical protein